VSTLMHAALIATTAIMLGMQAAALVTEPAAVQSPQIRNPASGVILHYGAHEALAAGLPSEAQIRAGLQTVGYTDISPADILLGPDSKTGQIDSSNSR
jgi:hypothetical protein